MSCVLVNDLVPQLLFMELHIILAMPDTGRFQSTPYPYADRYILTRDLVFGWLLLEFASWRRMMDISTIKQEDRVLLHMRDLFSLQIRHMVPGRSGKACQLRSFFRE